MNHSPDSGASWLRDCPRAATERRPRQAPTAATRADRRGANLETQRDAGLPEARRRWEKSRERRRRRETLRGDLPRARDSPGNRSRESLRVGPARVAASHGASLTASQANARARSFGYACAGDSTDGSLRSAGDPRVSWRSDVSSWVIDSSQKRCPLSWLSPGPSVLGQVSMIYESVRALGALLTTPPARLTMSIGGRFRLVVSAIAGRGTLNATRVHAKLSRANFAR
jgi:hypothetical protein